MNFKAASYFVRELQAAELILDLHFMKEILECAHIPAMSIEEVSNFNHKSS